MSSEFDEYGLDEDAWKAINPRGGRPRVVLEYSGVTRIIHGDGMVVRSHKSIAEYGVALIQVLGQTIKAPVALVQALHGDPCERQSRQNGGEGYNRDK